MMTSFRVYPAIDLRAGQVVRLKQGDPGRQTVYGSTPASTARIWIDQGASWLHVINLSGAFNESETENRHALEDILEMCKHSDPPVNVQFGGGLRSLQEINQLLSQGVSRVILGTLAVSDAGILADALARFGPRAITVAIDARDGKVKVGGWQRETNMHPLSFARRLKAFGVEIVIFTNISRDGTGRGVDVKASKQLAEETGLAVIASGGVSTLDDVRKVRAAGLQGVIIGRALYEGTFTLREALKC